MVRAAAGSAGAVRRPRALSVPAPLGCVVLLTGAGSGRRLEASAVGGPHRRLAKGSAAPVLRWRPSGRAARPSSGLRFVPLVSGSLRADPPNGRAARENGADDRFHAPNPSGQRDRDGGDDARVRSDGPRRRGGFVLCGSSEAGRLASVSHSDRGTALAMPRGRRAMRPGAARFLVATRPTRCARRDEPTRRNARLTNRSPRRVGPTATIARWFRTEGRAHCCQLTRGCPGWRRLRPDVADISRLRLTE
jgi:hypothetical protein